jgi:hypothetical protein
MRIILEIKLNVYPFKKDNKLTFFESGIIFESLVLFHISCIKTCSDLPFKSIQMGNYDSIIPFIK